MPESLRVYMSHAYADTLFSQKLATSLQEVGLDVRLGLSHTDSGDFVDVINQALGERDAFILVLSPDSLASRWVPVEMEMCIARYKQGLMRAPVIVMRAKVPKAGVPDSWLAFTRIDGSSELPTVRGWILRALGISLPSSPATPMAPHTPAPPMEPAYAVPAVPAIPAVPEFTPRTPAYSGAPQVAPPAYYRVGPAPLPPGSARYPGMGAQASSVPSGRSRRLLRIIIPLAIVGLLLLGGTGVLLAAVIHGRLASTPPTPIAQETTVKWKFATGGSVGEMNIYNNAIFVGSSDHTFYALDAATGALRWKASLDGSAIRAPANAGRAVIVLTSAGTLYSLDITKGVVFWHEATGADGEHGMAIANNTLYLPTPRSLRALNAATGKLIWSKGNLGSVQYVAIDNGTLYAGSDDTHVYALNATTGALLWKFQAGDIITDAPASDGTTVYLAAANHTIYALSAASGKMLWSYQMGGNANGRPLIAHGFVYVGATDAKMYAFDPSTGTVRWTYSTGGSVVEKPFYHQGTLYVGSTDASIYALDATKGTLRWRYKTGGPVTAPQIAYGVLFVGSADHYVYALAY